MAAETPGSGSTPLDGLRHPSMRPRCIGRGNHEQIGCSRRGTAPSMRPRPDWPRKRRAAGLSWCRPMAFNEAAAHWPRKRRPAGLPPARSRSFNEAAAHWPRKLRNARAHRLPEPASMRPRRIGRGNRHRARRAALRHHPFNEAAAHWPRKLPAGNCLETLHQFGRCSSNSNLRPLSRVDGPNIVPIQLPNNVATAGTYPGSSGPRPSRGVKPLESVWRPHASPLKSQ